MAMDHAVKYVSRKSGKLDSLLRHDHFENSALESLYGNFAAKCRRPALIQALFLLALYFWVTTLLRYSYGKIFTVETFTVAGCGVLCLLVGAALLNCYSRLAISSVLIYCLFLLLIIFSLLFLPVDFSTISDYIATGFQASVDFPTTISPSKGLLETFLIIYFVVAFLPLNLWLCCTISLLLAALQILAAFFFSHVYVSHIYHQVSQFKFL